MNKHVPESELTPKAITVLVNLTQLRHGSEYPGGSVNSRKVYRDKDVEELAHSLLPKNDGQLKPLLCCTHKDKPNLFFVFDGGRREASFEFAIKKGLLPKEHAIEIKDWGQITPELALQLSWAANEQVPLHPADRAEGFAKLSASKTPEQIAEERGMSAQAVKQSIALGTALAPEALQLWREDLIGREDVEVLVLGDIEQQQKVLEGFRDSFDCKHRKGINKAEVRRKLMKGKEPEMRRLLGFVGVAEYRGYGGVVVEDFFGEGGNVKDMKLLKKLANEAMAIIGRELEHAGWSWHELLLTESSMHHGHSQLDVTIKLTAEEKARMKEITGRLKAIEDSEEGTDDNSWAEQTRLEREEDLLEGRAQLRSYDAKAKAKSGVIVSLTPAGDVLYTAGLIRKVEPKASKKSAKTKSAAAPSAPRVPDIGHQAEEHIDEVQRQALKTLLPGKPREAFALFLAAATLGMYSAIEWRDLGDAGTLSKGHSLGSAFEELKKLTVDKLAARLATALADICLLDGSSDSLVIIEAVGDKALQAEFKKLFRAPTYTDEASVPHMLGIIAEARGEAERKALENADVPHLRVQTTEAIRLSGWMPPALRTKAYTGPTAKKVAKAKAKKSTKKGGK